MVLIRSSFTPSIFCFLFAAVLGVMISVSSDNWFGVWFGLEMNLVGFLPYMLGSASSMEVESTVKYFLVQVIGSALFLGGVMMLCSFDGNFDVLVLSSYWFSWMAWLGMLVKLGVAPFHFWVPASLAGVSWFCCFLLSTLQKVVPLVFMVFFLDLYWGVSMLVGGISSVVGGIGGINQTQLRPLLGYSSIGHMGWVLGGLNSGGSMVGAFYFLCYFYVSAGLFMYLSVLGVYYLKSFSQAFYGMKEFNIVYFGLFILSLGGFPPFLMFLGKVAVIFSLCNFFLWIPPYLLGALISLYYYLSLVFVWVSSRATMGMGIFIDEGVVNSVGLSMLMSQVIISFSGMLIVAMTVF